MESSLLRLKVPKSCPMSRKSSVLSNTWLQEQLMKPRSRFALIYRASRDGLAAATFHANCDNKGPTVTVIKSGNNIFGGYTEQSLDGKFFCHAYNHNKLWNILIVLKKFFRYITETQSVLK